MVDGKREKVRGLGLGLGLSLLGALFCAVMGLGWWEELCLTEGCALTKYIKVFGLSLWWWGTGVFFLMAVLVIVRRIRLAYVLSFVALAGDAVLLVWMAFMAPCFTCLLAGLLFLLVFFAIYKSAGARPAAARVLVAVWFFTFSPNFFAVILDLVEPWPIYGNAQAASYVYFSPTCPACQRTVFYIMPRLKGSKRTMAFYPIARSGVDLEKMKFIIHRLQGGQGFFEAYRDSLKKGAEKADLGLIENIRLKVRLYRNLIALSRTGMRGVPVIISRGGVGRPKGTVRPGGTRDKEPAGQSP